jgi:hypothetical protein
MTRQFTSEVRLLLAMRGLNSWHGVDPRTAAQRTGVRLKIPPPGMSRIR